MKRRKRLILLFVIAVVVAMAVNSSEPPPLARSQGGEPRFSFPGAGRFKLTSYFDHHYPDYSIDNELTIYTTERGLQSNGCPDCYWAGGVQVCGYYTGATCGGRRIYYDGHPAIDYGFPQNTPVTAALLGTAYLRTIGIVNPIYVVAIDHGNGYWSKYLHVARDSRIADGTAVERGRQIALSSNSGTGAYHLHFEVRYNGEDGPVLDPYGWLGPWQTDPWGQPFQHTADWWRSNDPIPMGFRDQNHAANGPFQLIGAIRDKWDALDGEPGSPVSAQTSGSCPGTYGDCQLFEKGYIRWDYSATAYSPYGATFLPDVKDENGWISTIVVRNNGSTAAQGSILFYDPAGHTIDSRTYIAVPPGGSWSLDTSAVFDTNQIWGVADTFSGSAVVYANRDVAVKAENQSPMANISYVGNQTPTTTAYLPNLVVRTTRQAYVSLQNAGANAATVSLNFYNRNGGLVHSRNETIPVNGSTMLLLNNIPDIVNGFAATSNTGSMFASVTNSVPIAVSAQVNYTDQNGAYAYGGVSTGDTTLWTPGVFRRVSGSTWLLYSAVNVQNLSASTTTIHVQFVNRSGTVTYEFDDTVAARSSVAYNTRYQGTTPSYIWNPLIAALGDDWAGSVRVSSNSGAPLAGVYLYFPAQYGTDMIAVPLTGQSQLTTGSLIAPAVYRQQSGSIWTHWTTVLVQNTTDNAASITVRIFDSAGNLQGNACTLSVPRLSYAALHLKTGVDLTPCNLLNTLGTNFTGSMLITSNDSRALLAIYYDFYESTGRISGDAATVRP